MQAPKMLKSAIAAAALCLASCAPLADAPGPDGTHPLQASVWDVAAGVEITPETLAARLDASDVAILGEVHDNPTHHARQAWLIRRIAPGGVAFEMVPEASEAGIAVFRDQGGDADEIGPAIGWDRLGWPDWEMYAPVFEAAGDAYIAGGGQGRGDIRRAISEGAGAAYGPGADAAGLSTPLAASLQAEAEAEMIAAHCDLLPAAAAPGMVEAQRLRDAAFARAALRAIVPDTTTGGRSVLVTGNGHARTDRGVPVYIARLAPGRQTLSLGQIEIRTGAETLDAYGGADGRLPYDFVWFSERVERDDPCAPLRQ